MAYRELAQVGSKLPKIKPVYVSEKSEKKMRQTSSPLCRRFPFLYYIIFEFCLFWLSKGVWICRCCQRYHTQWNTTARHALAFTTVRETRRGHGSKLMKCITRSDTERNSHRTTTTTQFKTSDQRPVNNSNGYDYKMRHDNDNSVVYITRSHDSSAQKYPRRISSDTCPFRFDSVDQQLLLYKS